MKKIQVKNIVSDIVTPSFIDIGMPISISLYRQVFYKIENKIKEMG